MIIFLLNLITRTCDFEYGCRLPYGHATGHQEFPTLREWLAGLAYQGREGNEKDDEPGVDSPGSVQ